MGKVYLVGAGPGDPDLITVKGMKAIQQADIILYDRLVHDHLLDYASPHADLIYCGKRPNAHKLSQDKINHLMCQFAAGNKVVTRLKGGDPFIFGRGGEEAGELKENGIAFEIVPGVTAASAAGAYAGIPLTHRNLSSSVAFITGTGKVNTDVRYWQHLAKGIDTLCIYMGVKNLPVICEKLLHHGMDPTTPIAVIHHGTMITQQTVTGSIGDIAEKAAALQNPSMIIIGEVVRLREELAWFEQMAKDETFAPQAILR